VSRLAGLVAVAALAVAVAALSGCGSSSSGSRTSGDALTIYASLPLRGDQSAKSKAVLDGARLALAENEGKVGKFRLRFSVLDDTKGDQPRWNPGQSAANARKAAQDRDAIAYIGDIDSGATAISIPITNEAGILQVSPTSSYTGLTRSEGGDKGEPEKYYPAGLRTFGRIVPGDQVQAPAIVNLLRDERVRSIFLVHDEDSYGDRLAAAVGRRASAMGIGVVGVERMKADPKSAAETADKVVRSGAQALVYTGSPVAAPALWKAAYRRDPDLDLFGAAPLADDRFARELGPAATRTFLTSPALRTDSYSPSARRFARSYRARFGHGPPPYAIQGYEAVQAIVSSIRAAGENGNDRREVIRNFFRIDGRRSVLGTYSIDGNGDTTLSRYGSYVVRDGRLRFLRVLDPVQQQ
jgi:branched-chain amino acid transport system substrate-binding protein